MNDTIQQILVVAVVLGAVLYLAFRARKKGPGKGGCGCGTKKPPPLS
jgi:hypothetical protein